MSPRLRRRNRTLRVWPRQLPSAAEFRRAAVYKLQHARSLSTTRSLQVLRHGGGHRGTRAGSTVPQRTPRHRVVRASHLGSGPPRRRSNRQDRQTSRLHGKDRLQALQRRLDGTAGQRCRRAGGIDVARPSSRSRPGRSCGARRVGFQGDPRDVCQGAGSSPLRPGPRVPGDGYDAPATVSMTLWLGAVRRLDPIWFRAHDLHLRDGTPGYGGTLSVGRLVFHLRCATGRSRPRSPTAQCGSP
jgi:hypothetical protein